MFHFNLKLTFVVINSGGFKHFYLENLQIQIKVLRVFDGTTYQIMNTSILTICHISLNISYFT